MAITTLDTRCALVVIDLQKGMQSYALAQPLADIVTQAQLLLAAFRQHGLPVVLVNVAGRPPGRSERAARSGQAGRQLPADFAGLLPELNQQPQDHVVTKYTPGAFTNTDLHAWLTAQGVTQIVCAGVATSNGVEATARHAFELGYNLAFATDAMTDADSVAHVHSVSHIFPKIGETATTEEIIHLLADRS